MPPRLALSLLKMSIPTDQHDAVVGDLLEEFSDRARGSELMTARRWFWRQTWKTIGHFLLGPFRETPVATAATIVSALFLLKNGGNGPHHASPYRHSSRLGATGLRYHSV